MNNRHRTFYRLCKGSELLLALFAASICLSNLRAEDRKPPGGVSDKRGASGDGHEAEVLKAGWYYTWYIDPYTKPADAEFVPMIAHGKDVNPWYFGRIKAVKDKGNVKCLLAFNEPDRKAPEGGDISPESAVEVWPAFEKTGLRLGSPAVAFDDAGKKWLDDFMTKSKAKNRKIDFIAVHWYGDVADPQAATKFMDWLKEIHEKYDKPIWITEFAGLNWKWLDHQITTAQNERFLREILPQIEKTSWIERYCWFSAEPASLYGDDKRTTLSKLGQLYRDGG